MKTELVFGPLLPLVLVALILFVGVASAEEVTIRQGELVGFEGTACIVPEAAIEIAKEHKEFGFERARDLYFMYTQMQLCGQVPPIEVRIGKQLFVGPANVVEAVSGDYTIYLLTTAVWKDGVI